MFACPPVVCVNVRIKCVFGNSEIFGDLVAGLGDEERAVLAQKAGWRASCPPCSSAPRACPPGPRTAAMSSSSTSLTLMMRLRLRLRAVAGRTVSSRDGALDHQQRGDVVVDAEDGHDLAPLVADVHRGGLEDLAVRRLGEIAQVILGLLRPALRTCSSTTWDAPSPTLRPVTWPFSMMTMECSGWLGCHVVDHDLAAAAELGGDALGNLPQSLQL